MEKNNDRAISFDSMGYLNYIQELCNGVVGNSSGGILETQRLKLEL